MGQGDFFDSQATSTRTIGANQVEQIINFRDDEEGVGLDDGHSLRIRVNHLIALEQGTSQVEVGSGPGTQCSVTS